HRRQHEQATPSTSSAAAAPDLFGVPQRSPAGGQAGAAGTHPHAEPLHARRYADTPLGKVEPNRPHLETFSERKPHPVPYCDRAGTVRRDLTALPDPPAFPAT